MRWWHASIVLVLPAAAVAQATASDADSTVDRHGRLGIEAWAGRARSSARLGFLGSAPDLGLTLGAVRITRTLHRTAHVAVDYAVEVVPVAHLARHVVRTGTKVRIVCRRTGMCESVADDILLQGSADGVGVSPVGLTATFRPAHALALGLGGTGGLMWFDERVPTSGAAQLNFTAMAEATVAYVDRRGMGPVLAYRFHHISNGGRADENAAIASHVLSLGVRWRLAGGSSRR